MLYKCFVLAGLLFSDNYYVSPTIEGRYIALRLTTHLLVTSVSCLCVLSIYHAGGQTRDVDTMLGYCWPTVYNPEQTLVQYSV